MTPLTNIAMRKISKLYLRIIISNNINVRIIVFIYTQGFPLCIIKDFSRYLKWNRKKCVCLKSHGDEPPLAKISNDIDVVFKMSQNISPLSFRIRGVKESPFQILENFKFNWFYCVYSHNFESVAKRHIRMLCGIEVSSFESLWHTGPDQTNSVKI